MKADSKSSCLFNLVLSEVKQTLDYSILESKKIIVRLMEIGVKISDEQFEQNSDFDQNKKDFVKDESVKFIL